MPPNEASFSGSDRRTSWVYYKGCRAGQVFGTRVTRSIRWTGAQCNRLVLLHADSVQKNEVLDAVLPLNPILNVLEVNRWNRS